MALSSGVIDGLNTAKLAILKVFEKLAVPAPTPATGLVIEIGVPLPSWTVPSARSSSVEILNGSPKANVKSCGTANRPDADERWTSLDCSPSPRLWGPIEKTLPRAVDCSYTQRTFCYKVIRGLGATQRLLRFHASLGSGST